MYLFAMCSVMHGFFAVVFLVVTLCSFAFFSCHPFCLFDFKSNHMNYVLH